MSKASLQPLVSKAVLSVETLLELKDKYKHIENKLFSKLSATVQDSKLDMWSQSNYAILLFSAVVHTDTMNFDMLIE